MTSNAAFRAMFNYYAETSGGCYRKPIRPTYDHVVEVLFFNDAGEKYRHMKPFALIYGYDLYNFETRKSVESFMLLCVDYLLKAPHWWYGKNASMRLVISSKLHSNPPKFFEYNLRELLFHDGVRQLADCVDFIVERRKAELDGDTK